MQQEYVGTWTTRDGYFAKELFPDGRFAEKRGGNQTIASGNYTVKGRKIVYKRSEGFSTSADFFGGLMYENGHIFYPGSVDAVKEANLQLLY